MGTHKQNQAAPKSSSRLVGNTKESPVLNGLRKKIRAIEQCQTPFPENNENWLLRDQTTPSIDNAAEMPARTKLGWNFGVDEIDEALPGRELNRSALHEIKPKTYQDSHAALGFAMALIGRRVAHIPDATLLWCLPPVFSNEFGAPYGPGLRHLIPRPENCLITQPKNQAHLLWAIEEGLNASGGTSARNSPDTSVFAIVLANLKTIEPTPARRLKLRASLSHTPALLLTHHNSPGINMVETRWHIARAQSESGEHYETAPGRAKWSVTLERGGHGNHELNWILEWHHETHSFTLVSPLADRAPQTTRTRFGTG